MDGSVDGGAKVLVRPYCFNHIRTAARSNSLSSSASIATNSQPAYSSAITFTSIHTKSPTSSEAVSIPHLRRQRDNMTVYYQYDETGKLLSTSNVELFVQQAVEYFDPSYYLQRGDIVGAYLARRDVAYTGSLNIRTQDFAEFGKGRDWQGQQWMHGHQHIAGRSQEVRKSRHDSYPPQPNRIFHPNSNVGNMDPVVNSAQPHAYSNLEDIRCQYTLHDLLPYIHPARRLSALSGPALDVIEEDTLKVLAHDVPKKLLILFFGRNTVTKFIKTVGVRYSGFENFHKKQKMFVPRGISSVAAMRILLAWLFRACRMRDLGTIRPFNVPHNHFAAATLSQTLAMFGLHRDALRIDTVIAKDHLKRPIFADELEQIWNCLGPSNRYTYAAIRVVGERLEKYEQGMSRALRKPDAILELLARNSELKLLVKNTALNKQNQPAFSTEWCRSDERGAQHSQRIFNGYPARGPGKGLPFPPAAPNNSEARESSPMSESTENLKMKHRAAVLRILPATGRLKVEAEDCEATESLEDV